MFKRTGTLLLALALVFGISACSSPAAKTSAPNPSAATSAKAAKTTINVGVANDPGTMDVCGTPSNSCWEQVAFNVYDSLFTLDSNRKEIPRLAESWEKIDDYTFIFHLRKNVKYSDGTPFKAGDILATLNFYKGSTSGRLGVANINWDKTKVVDDNTMQICFTLPSPSQFSSLASIKITSEAACKEGNKQKTVPTGTNAYMLKEWVMGSSVTLVANPNYWGTKPVIQTVVYKVIADTSQRTNALLAGNVDMVIQTSSNDIDLIKKDGKFTVNAFSNNGCDSILFNNAATSVCKNLDLRKAIAYATDKAGIQKAAYAGVGNIATIPIPKTFKDYDKSWQIDGNYYEFNMDKAKEYYQKAGIPAGTTLTIITNGAIEYMKAAQIVQASLLKLGINSKINTVDPSVFQKTILDPSGWDMAFLGLGVPSLVTVDLYNGYFINQKYGSYAADDFTALVKEGLMQSDITKEAAIAKKLIDADARDLPRYAYMESPIIDSYVNNLQGFEPWYIKYIPISLLSFK